MKYEFDLRRHGVCASRLTVEASDGIVRSAHIEGGCPGWRAFAERVMTERPVVECIELMRGVECGERGTSCANEVAKCLEGV